MNLNWSGRFDVEGPQPPSGLSFIGGSVNEAMVDFEMQKKKSTWQTSYFGNRDSVRAAMKSVQFIAFTRFLLTIYSVVKEINKINQLELDLGVSGASWHDEYKDSAYVFVGGIPFDLTEGDVITIFSQ